MAARELAPKEKEEKAESLHLSGTAPQADASASSARDARLESCACPVQAVGFSLSFSSPLSSLLCDF